MDTVDSILKRLQSYHPKTIDLGLDRTFRLLEKCGNPHESLPPVIHIAGTNGKGSTLSFMQSICESAGLRVHRYTSPELIKFNERFIVSGSQITDSDLLDALLYVERQNQGQEITFFEITTVAGFYIFANTPADILLLETGLGGRLDSTNVVANPMCTILANIGYDHQDFLGSTIAKITQEKAGILRKKVPAIIAPQCYPQAYITAESSAQRVGAKYMPVPEIKHTSSGFILARQEYPAPNLVGTHQYANSATAIYALQQVMDIPHGVYVNGIQNAVHRGRFETVYIHNKTIYIDGGHNADAGRCLARILQDKGIKNIPLVCGMLEGKDIKGFIDPLRPYISDVYTVPVSNNLFATAKGLPAGTLAQILRDMGISTTPCDGVLHALETIQSDTVLCAGSLHLVGDVLSMEN